MNKKILIQIKKRSDITPNNIPFVGLGQLGSVTIPENVDCLYLSQKGEIISLLGITGSANHKIKHDSKKILLEIANFNWVKISKNAFSLNYRSPSSKLFSSNISQNLAKIAFIKYNTEIKAKGGKINQKLIHNTISNKNTSNTNSFELDLNWFYCRISSTLSDTIKKQVIEKIQLFGKLVSTNEHHVFYPKNIYNVIYNKYDLLQEVIRLFDFSAINDKPLSASLINHDYQSSIYENKVLQLKNYISSLCFNEVITRPFVDSQKLNNLQSSIKVLNPNSSLDPYLSDNLTYRLLKIYVNNLNLAFDNCNIFEINSVFSKSYNNFEELSLCLVFQTQNKYLATTFANKVYNFCYSEDCLNFEKSINNDQGLSTVYKNTHGNLTLTQISKKVLKHFDIPLNQTIWTIELPLKNISDFKLKKYKDYKDENFYSVISRTISLEVDETEAQLTNENLVLLRSKLIEENDLGWSISTKQLDLFKHINNNEKQASKHTVSLQITFNSESKNLTGQEVDQYLASKGF